MSEPGIPTQKPRHWLEYITTAVAVIVSLTSLWVAIGSEEANRQMVAASSWPFLQVGSSSVDPSGHSVLSFGVSNSGVGPAKIRTFEVFYKGHPVRGAVELMRACCAPKFTRMGPSDVAHPDPNDYFITGGVPGTVIRAGETRNFIIYGLSPHTEDTWRILDRQRQRNITYRICYCSVFDECWQNTLKGRDQLDPVRVKTCPVPAVGYSE